MIVPEKPARDTREQFHKRLTAMIKRYWKDLGCTVDVRTKQTKVNNWTIYYLESDTVNGLPRDFTGSLRHLSAVNERPEPPDTSAVRDCMTCGKPFESEGIGNRMCEKCRSK